MKVFEAILLLSLIGCAVSVAFTKDLLTSIIIFMSYSLIMCVIWILLESPDLAVTEAAVGAGVTSILFFVTLKKIRAIRKEDQDPFHPFPGNGFRNRLTDPALLDAHVDNVRGVGRQGQITVCLHDQDQEHKEHRFPVHPHILK